MVQKWPRNENEFNGVLRDLQMLATQTNLRTRGMELLVAYHQKPTVRLRNQLVQMNVGLVRKIAHRISHQCAEPYEDLEQIGYLGLIRAIERFNPNQGCAFSSFAVPYIRGEMLHFLRDRSGTVKIPRRWQQINKEGQRVREALALELNRQPSDDEVALELGVTVQEWRDSKLAAKNRLPLSLDATICQQLDSPMTLGDTIPDARYQELQVLEEDRQQLQKALNQLEDKTRQAIEYVFLHDLSRKEVAERIGVSPMTVTRRIHRGVQQMVSTLKPQMAQTDP
jgi:RNA polymerase sigma-B factor